MKRVIAILLGILILLGAASYLAYANSNLILAHIISRKTHLPVTIKKISYHKNAFVIHDLQLANPKGTRLPTALKTETIQVDAPHRQYLEDPIVINQIHVNHSYVNIQVYNKAQTEGNWHTIINNMSEDHNSPLSVERPSVIKKLILTNIQIDLILADGSIRHLTPIERIEFDNVNSERGIPIEEISEIIVQKMMGQIFIEKGLKTIIQAPVNIIKGVIPFL